MDAPATEATLEMVFELAKVGLLEFLGINTWLLQLICFGIQIIAQNLKKLFQY